MNTNKSWLEKNISLPVLVNPEAEKENYITHAIPAVFAIVGLIYIVVKNNNNIGMIIFALANILLYTASSLYHYLPANNVKRVCRILDHSNIYILIAGSYTPILFFINTNVTTNLTILVWGIALAGILFSLIFWGRLKPLHVVLYIIMGWLICFFWNDIIPFLPEGLFKYILSGGIVYTLGVIFYGFKKIPHGHAIWHLFCIGGSLCFYIGYLKYVL